MTINIDPPDIPIKSEPDEERVLQRVAIGEGIKCPHCKKPTIRFAHPPGWTPPPLVPVYHVAWDVCPTCPPGHRRVFFPDEFRCTQVVPPTPPVAPAPPGEGDEFTKVARPRMTRDKPQYAGCSPPRSPRRQRHPGDWPYTIDPPNDPKWSGWGVDRTGRSNKGKMKKTRPRSQRTAAPNVSARSSPVSHDMDPARPDSQRIAQPASPTQASSVEKARHDADRAVSSVAAGRHG
jgi:hypothetical protein